MLISAGTEDLQPRDPLFLFKEETMTIEIIQTLLPLLMTGTEDDPSVDPERLAGWNERLVRELKECEMICSHAGIRTGKVTGIRVNPGLNCAWGRCITSRSEGTHEIEINRALMSESIPNLSLKKTILHELCHTVKDGHGHKNGWLEAAARLKQVYGLQLSRTNTAEELSVTEIPEKELARFVFRCIVCGAVVERSRHSAFVDHYERYRCGNCGGRFEPV